jgi:hypothetical protein
MRRKATFVACIQNSGRRFVFIGLLYDGRCRVTLLPGGKHERQQPQQNFIDEGNDVWLEPPSRLKNLSYGQF